MRILPGNILTRAGRHRLQCDQNPGQSTGDSALQDSPERPNTGAHLHEDDYLLLFSEQLEPDRLAVARTHLADCHLCQSELTAAYFAAVVHGKVAGRQSLGHPQNRISTGERRVEYRHPVQDAAILRVLCPYRLAPAEICIIDVSRRGVRFRSPLVLHPGTLIQVRTTRLIILAEVRHCVGADQVAWYVGCQISDVFEPAAI